MAQWWARLRAFARAIAIGVATVAALTALVCWLIGWHTWPQYGKALLGAGLFVATLGGIGFSSTNQLLGSPNFWYAQSVMPNSLFERWQMNMASLHESLDVTVVMIACGGVVMLCGLAALTL
jgi:hypothetical protein